MEISFNDNEVADGFMDLWERKLPEVRSAYEANLRVYHVWPHAASVTNRAIKFGRYYGIGRMAMTHLIIAASCHDAIYRPGSKTNELESAEFADRVFGEFELFGEYDKQWYVWPILDTTHIAAPVTLLGAILCDADLWGLGGYEDQYATSAEWVRSEYEFYGVTDLQWLQGRMDFLDSMLSRSHIYTLGHPACAERQERAFWNMRQERYALASLV